MTSLVFALALATLVPLEVEPLRTVVLPLEVREGVAPELGLAASDVVYGVYAQNPRRRVLKESDLTRALDAEKSRMLTGCTTATCMADVAKLVAADRIVFGAIASLGTSTLVTIHEIDARSLVPLGRGEEVASPSLRELTTVARDLARDVESRALARPEEGASLIVESTPPGIIVDVDGRPVGVTPTTIRELSMGPRRVSLRPADGPPVVVTVPVAAEGSTYVSAEIGRVTPPTPAVLEDHADSMFWAVMLRELKFASCAGTWFILLPALALASFGVVGGIVGPAETRGQDAITAIVLGGGALFFGVPMLLVGVWGLSDFLFVPPAPVDVETPTLVTITPPPSAGPTTTIEVKRTTVVAP